MCVKNNCFDCFSEINCRTKVVLADFSNELVRKEYGLDSIKSNEISFSRLIDSDIYDFEVILNSRVDGKHQRYGFYFELSFIHLGFVKRDYNAIYASHNKALEVLMPEVEIRALWSEYKSVGKVVSYFGLEDRHVVERLIRLGLIEFIGEV